MTTHEDEATIRSMIAAMSEAWARGDAKAWAEPFAEDVDFVVRDGSFTKGKAAVERDHARFFSTFYKGTSPRTKIRSIRFPRNDVAVMHTETSIAKKADEFPENPQFRAVWVLVKDQGRWQVIAFQNTMVGEPV